MKGDERKRCDTFPFPNSEAANHIARELETTGVRKAFTSGRKIGEMIAHKGDRKYNERSVVYQIPCGSCDKSYIGETGKGMGKRVSEHKRDFRNWLSGRTQAVTGAADALDVTHGVIQGSILGPILFIISTSDLPQHVPNCKLVSYTDDCQFFDADSPSEIRSPKSRVEDTLETVLTWLLKIA